MDLYDIYMIPPASNESDSESNFFFNEFTQSSDLTNKIPRMLCDQHGFKLKQFGAFSGDLVFKLQWNYCQKLDINQTILNESKSNPKDLKLIIKINEMVSIKFCILNLIIA